MQSSTANDVTKRKPRTLNIPRKNVRKFLFRFFSQNKRTNNRKIHIEHKLGSLLFTRVFSLNSLKPCCAAIIFLAVKNSNKKKWWNKLEKCLEKWEKRECFPPMKRKTHLSRKSIKLENFMLIGHFHCLIILQCYILEFQMFQVIAWSFSDLFWNVLGIFGILEGYCWFDPDFHIKEAVKSQIIDWWLEFVGCCMRQQKYSKKCCT